MYQFSRAIYRELAPHVLEKKVNPQAGSNRALVVRACEDMMNRLAEDPRHLQHPDQLLFEQIRAYFPITKQLQVFSSVRQHMHLASEYVNIFAARGYKPDGTRLRCRATTRRSTPCMRAPVIGSEFCPSHQHLATPHFAQQAEIASAA